MLGPRIAIDGLWRCLCPSFDATVLASAWSSGPATSTAPTSTPTPTRRWASRHPTGLAAPASASSRQSQRCQTRRFHASGPRGQEPAARSRPSAASAPDATDILGISSSISLPHPSLLPDLDEEEHFARPPALDDPLSLFPPIKKKVPLGETPPMGPRNKALARAAQNVFSAGVLGAKHARSAYIFFLAKNCRREGSADMVRQILDAMRRYNVDIDSRHYHTALRALAIHPDYLLRTQLLKEMRDQWIELKPEGYEAVLVGLLRDGQYELALDTLEEAVRDAINIPDWVFEIFIYTFARLGFHDELFKLITYQLHGRWGGIHVDLCEDESEDGQVMYHDISPNVWYYVLDSCSRALHYAGTKYVWNRAVLGSGSLNPPDGVLLNVLNTAARCSDADMATQAIKMIASRGTRLSLHHYEPLVKCHAGKGDLESALRVLCIMQRADVTPDAGSTRQIYRMLCARSADESEAAIKLLFRLKMSEGKSGVPIAAVNVVLEALLFHGMPVLAMDLYRHSRLIVPAGPNLDTFNLLLRGYKNAEAARFLVTEMAQMRVRPDITTLDSLIRTHSDRSALGLALYYFRRLNRLSDADPAPGKWMRLNTAIALLRRCIQEEHEATWEIIDQCQARRMNITSAVKKLYLEKNASSVGRKRPWSPGPSTRANPKDGLVAARC